MSWHLYKMLFLFMDRLQCYPAVDSDKNHYIGSESAPIITETDVRLMSESQFLDIFADYIILCVLLYTFDVLLLFCI